ncbi:MAG: tetratricopeptide repeat protein [Pseudomonadota bacterium]
MKTVSTLALAAALTLGLAATPALAQKKKDKEQEQQGPTLKVSEAFRKPAAAAETALKAQDWATADTQLAAAEAVAVNDDEKYYAAFMRMSIEIHKQSMPGIIAAADALIASPKTPPTALGEYYYKRGQATFIGGKHGDAVPFLLKSRELGYQSGETFIMLAQAYVETGKVREGVDEMGKAIDAVKAKGQKPPEAWYKFAVAKTYGTGDRAATAAWMMRQLQDYPTVENWRKVFVIYRDSLDKSGTPLDRNQKIDLFRLMRFTGALADQNDYFDYGSFAAAAGLPWETRAVLEEGTKAGKIPKGNADFVKLGTTAETAIRNEGALTTAPSDTGKMIMGTADAFLASANYPRALELYDAALAKGGVDADQVQLHRGVALVQLGRKDEARTAFAAVRAAPLADMAKFWVVWLDMPPLT